MRESSSVRRAQVIQHHRRARAQLQGACAHRARRTIRPAKMGLMRGLLLAAALPHGGLALQNGFPLPQLGWNSWNHFACGVTEHDIRNTADAFVATGMKDAGCAHSPPPPPLVPLCYWPPKT